VIEAIADLGYPHTRLGHVVAAAGISRKTFYEHYRDLDDAFLEAYDLHVAALTEDVQNAFLGDASAAKRRWPDQIRDGVRAFLGYLQEHPAAAKVCLVDALGAGKEARSRRDAALRSFTFFVDSGRGETAHEVPGRTALAVLGGANELIAWELLHGSPRKLEALAPELVYMIVLPFLGPKKALAEREKTVASIGSTGGGAKKAAVKKPPSAKTSAAPRRAAG
jgi:AcrR family transcriptional regulator